MNTSPQVYFIGAGPGDPDLITVRGRDLVAQADLVLYAGSLVPAKVVGCARSGAVVADSAGMSLEQTHALMLETARKGRDRGAGAYRRSIPVRLRARTDRAAGP